MMIVAFCIIAILGYIIFKFVILELDIVKDIESIFVKMPDHLDKDALIKAGYLPGTHKNNSCDKNRGTCIKQLCDDDNNCYDLPEDCDYRKECSEDPVIWYTKRVKNNMGYDIYDYSSRKCNSKDKSCEKIYYLGKNDTHKIDTKKCTYSEYCASEGTTVRGLPEDVDYKIYRCDNSKGTCAYTICEEDYKQCDYATNEQCGPIEQEEICTVPEPPDTFLKQSCDDTSCTFTECSIKYSEGHCSKTICDKETSTCGESSTCTYTANCVF